MINLTELVFLRSKMLAKFPNHKLDSVANCSIILDHRMRSTAGKANYTTNSIHLNVRLLEPYPDHVVSTFVHELAHLISVAIHGRVNGRGHGAEWSNVMRTLGYAPERQHGLDTSRLKRPHATMAIAKCSCNSYDIKPRRYAKMMNGAKYRCKKCHDYLRIRV